MFTLSETTYDYLVRHWILVHSPEWKILAKSFRMQTITYNNQDTINNCNTIKTEDNI